MSSTTVREAAFSAVEFCFLLLLWMMFVSKLSWQETAIGAAAALAGAVGDAIVKSQGLAIFRPRLRWLLLIFWEPWYAIKGTAVVFRELARNLIGKRPRAQFQAVPYQFGGDDEVSAGRRTLFAAYVTISPDTIVVGLDRKQQIALVHQLGSHDLPAIAQQLGAKK